MGVSRLSVLLPSLEGGGAERSVARIASELAAAGHSVTLLLGRATGPYLSELHPAVAVHDLRATSMVTAVGALVRHLRQARPDVLLSALSHANVAAAAAHGLARSRARLVLSERVHFSALLREQGGWRLHATQALMRLTYRRAACVVAVSHDVADDLCRTLSLDPARVVVLPNPVVDDNLRQRAAEPPHHPWLAQPGPPVVLAAGRLNAQKDFATLVDAFARLRRQRPARLLILGEGELRPALEAQVRTLGLQDDVALPGFDENPFPAMRTAAVFVLSSRFEGLPGVLIQAMACGARVVATDCPSGPREVLQDGRWGRLVPVGDVAAMAQALAAALDDPAPPDVRVRAADYRAEAAAARYAEVLGLPPASGASPR